MSQYSYYHEQYTLHLEWQGAGWYGAVQEGQMYDGTPLIKEYKINDLGVDAGHETNDEARRKGLGTPKWLGEPYPEAA